MLVIHKWPKVKYHCFLGGLIGGALDIVGGIIGADMQNSASESMQSNNIEWQREQLQNKHQWEVEDLRKAGLNPILSAPNASSAVSAGSPQGANPNIQLSKALEALSNSALMQKETELKKFALDTDRIKADAAMIEAKSNEAVGNSAIEKNQTEADLNVTNIWRISEITPLEVAYTKANISKTEQDMLNSIAQVQALIQLYDRQGTAALMMGEAAQSSAVAANRQAAAQEIIASVAEQNGVSERALKAAMTGEADQRTKESAARVEEILTQNKALDWQIKRDMYHNPNASGRDTGFGSGNMLFGFGELLRNGLGGSLNFSVHK